MRTITEPVKQIRVVAEVDVVVAGAGVSGVFAGIAAARAGARTMVIDRFGSVGGNIGPGMIVNGGMLPGSPHRDVGHERTVYPGSYGIAREFIHRYAELGGGGLQPYQSGAADRAGDASIASYLAQRMLEEAGASLLLSTTVADPVMEGNRVCGVFVENKSGRGAVLARVVIDGTGEADVAKRAGAPMLYPKAEYHEVDGHSPTGAGIFFLVGGVDWDRYQCAMNDTPTDSDDYRWAVETLGEGGASRARAVLAPLRAAYESGDYRLGRTVTLDGAEICITASYSGPIRNSDTVQGRGAPDRTRKELDVGNAEHVSILEAATRAEIFEMWHFWKRHAPGFENSSLLCIAPFYGVRGGPCIEGDYTLTMDDCRAGRLFDDVIYRYGEFRALRWTAENGGVKWVDVPYRVMLPKTIDGLLCTGRSASGKPDTLLRNRWAVKIMGEACGRAAALAAEQNIMPREINIKQLQTRLLDAGFHLGDRHRLRELDLI